MRHQFITFINLSYPFAIGVILLLCLPFLKIDTENRVKFSFFGLGNFSLPIKSKFLVRVLLSLVAFFFFTMPAFRDYSGLYPSHYDMDVYFDDEGIEKALQDFTDEEIKALQINGDWKRGKKLYLQKLTKDLSSLLGICDFFSRGSECIHSTGRTAFIVDKIEGWQNYYIREGVGQLTHTLELPNQEIKQFHSKFELMKTGDNYIHATLLDIYVGFTKILKPRFKQIANISASQNEFYHHYLVAAIKIWFFPVCRVGNTIYLVKNEDDKTYVPIGWAAYRPSK